MDEPLSFEQRPENIARTKAVALPQAVRKRVRHTVHRDGAKLISVVELKAPVRDVTEAVAAFQDRVEHRREVAGRGIDDLQHLGSRGLLLQRLVTLGFALG